jgi:hypothetical protein
MANSLLEADEAEFAGYVDSGIWEIEEFLRDRACEKNVLDLYFSELWLDYFGNGRRHT